MTEAQAENELVVAHREVVERIWERPLYDACGDRLPTPEEASVLVAEARCGYIPLQLHERLAGESRIIAVEHERELLDDARARAESEGAENIFFVAQRVSDLSYADGVFEGGVCLNGLVTSRQTAEVVEELARVLASGAKLAIGGPLADSFPVFYDMLDEALRHHELDHVLERIDELRDSLLNSARLLQISSEAQLTDPNIEEYEWELQFDSGFDFLHSPLVRATFFPHWIGTIRSSEREPVLRYIADAIDTYWHEREFSTPIRAAVMVAEVE